MSIKALIASTGIGVLVVLLQELAMGLIFASDETEDFTANTEAMAKAALEAQVQLEEYNKRVSETRGLISQPLPETDEERILQIAKLQKKVNTDIKYELLGLQYDYDTHYKALEGKFTAAQAKEARALLEKIKQHLHN